MGLQQGIIDAQENPIETIVASKVYEQQGYIMKTNHILHTLSLIGSPKILDALPVNLQKVIQDSADEAKVYAREQTDKRSSSRIKILKESGTQLIDYNDTLFNDMREKTRPVWTTIEDKIGKELMDTLICEIEKAEKESEKNKDGK